MRRLMRERESCGYAQVCRPDAGDQHRRTIAIINMDEDFKRLTRKIEIAANQLRRAAEHEGAEVIVEHIRRTLVRRVNALPMPSPEVAAEADGLTKDHDE